MLDVEARLHGRADRADQLSAPGGRAGGLIARPDRHDSWPSWHRSLSLGRAHAGGRPTIGIVDHCLASRATGASARCGHCSKSPKSCGTICRGSDRRAPGCANRQQRRERLAGASSNPATACPTTSAYAAHRSSRLGRCLCHRVTGTRNRLRGRTAASRRTGAAPFAAWISSFGLVSASGCVRLVMRGRAGVALARPWPCASLGRSAVWNVAEKT